MAVHSMHYWHRPPTNNLVGVSRGWKRLYAKAADVADLWSAGPSSAAVCASARVRRTVAAFRNSVISMSSTKRATPMPSMSGTLCKPSLAFVVSLRPCRNGQMRRCTARITRGGSNYGTGLDSDQSLFKWCLEEGWMLRNRLAFRTVFCSNGFLIGFLWFSKNDIAIYSTYLGVQFRNASIWILEGLALWPTEQAIQRTEEVKLGHALASIKRLFPRLMMALLQVF